MFTCDVTNCVSVFDVLSNCCLWIDRLSNHQQHQHVQHRTIHKGTLLLAGNDASCMGHLSDSSRGGSLHGNGCLLGSIWYIKTAGWSMVSSCLWLSAASTNTPCYIHVASSSITHVAVRCTLEHTLHTCTPVQESLHIVGKSWVLPCSLTSVWRSIACGKNSSSLVAVAPR